MTESQQEGLYGKFIIRKADGTPIDSKAKYIVLRYDVDSKDGSASRHAIIAYARSIKSSNPQFADDLLKEMEVEYFKHRKSLYDNLED